MINEIFKPQLDDLAELSKEQQLAHLDEVYILIKFKDRKHNAEVWAIEPEKIDSLEDLKYLGMSTGNIPMFQAESFDHAWKLLARERWKTHE